MHEETQEGVIVSPTSNYSRWDMMWQSLLDPAEPCWPLWFQPAPWEAQLGPARSCNCVEPTEADRCWQNQDPSGDASMDVKIQGPTNLHCTTRWLFLSFLFIIPSQELSQASFQRKSNQSACVKDANTSERNGQEWDIGSKDQTMANNPGMS